MLFPLLVPLTDSLNLGTGMAFVFRQRRWLTAALLVLLVSVSTACGGDYPNSTFNHTTDFNKSIDILWDKLLFWGTIVFVLVEVALVYVIVRFRRKPGSANPKPVHGNTMLEILWTAIPAVILIFIAIPNVRTIFATQAKAAPDALQVEVIGHQWWWEFKYPEYGITTANEIYLPKGRTVNFVLTSVDVLHSFWIPQLGGKRDLITNRTNYLWFTPNEDLETAPFNGFCAEYCGASHANMKFRTYVVEPEDFESWARHQAGPAIFPVAVVADSSAAADSTFEVVPPAPAYEYPADKLPLSVIPTTRLPEGLTFDEAALAAGDATRGRELFGRSTCIGCHAISGVPGAVSPIGPNLTHVGSRHTIAAGFYPNEPLYMALWIKNSPVMKPGSLMPSVGIGEHDPVRKNVISASLGGLTDAQIADLVAYLQALK